MSYFNNPFGWDWMPHDEEVINISTGTPWKWNTWSFKTDPYEDYKKIAKTFEEIKNVKIHLTFDKDPRADQAGTQGKRKDRFGFRHNQLTVINNEFYLNVNTTNEKFLTNASKVDHNISHIVYDSPIKESKHLAHRLSLGSGIPDELKDPKLSISPDCNLCEDIARHVFDILEDVRVDSLWGELYMGTQMDYDDCQEKVKKQLKNPITNPIQALWYARNGKFDDSEMSKIAEQFINDIKETDYPAGPLLQKAYFQNVVLPWLKQQKFDNSNKNEKSKKKCNNKEKKPSTPNRQNTLEDLLKSIGKDIKKIREQHNVMPDHRGMEISLNHKKRKTIEKTLAEPKREFKQNDLGKHETVETEFGCGGVTQETDGDPIGEFNNKPGVGGGSGKSYDMYDPSKINQLKERGRERNNRIRNNLITKGLIKDKTLEAYNFDPEQFDIITRDNADVPYVTDQNTVKRLMRVWQQARGEVREITDDEGDDIDIDAYIQEIPSAYKDNIIFINEKDEPGLHIVYSADCSGSMDGMPLRLLRDVTATIKQSLQYEPKIKMSMIGWGGGNKTGISVHTKMDDINKFTVKHNYGGTPEANALWYSSTWLQRQPELTKVIFFVSDGAFSEELAKEQVAIARGNGIHVFGIGICDENNVTQKQHGNIFGAGNYTIVDEDRYTHGLNILVNDIAEFISRHIKSVA